ncbi:hypothetical protein X975_09155, partial [Stegodyphus mimosarum]
MKSILMHFSQKGHIAEKECNNILLEYSDFIENVVQPGLTEFKTYDVRKMRLDTFLHTFINGKYLKLWETFKVIFILFHGQASVERGFSINKNIETKNRGENSYIVQRIVCDYVKHAGGIHNVSIMTEMRAA